MKLTIVRGLPGSGKSTYAKSLGCFHVEADMYHMVNGEYRFSLENVGNAHAWCNEQVENALKNGMDVVVSNTFTREWEIAPYVDLAMQYNTQFDIIKMTGNYGTIHNVPEDVMLKMKERFEDIEGEIIHTESKDKK